MRCDSISLFTVLIYIHYPYKHKQWPVILSSTYASLEMYYSKACWYDHFINNAGQKDKPI